MRLKRFYGRSALCLFTLLLMSLLATAQADNRPMGEGTDLEIGGFGAGHGRFVSIADMGFDTNNNLVVLDTFWKDDPQKYKNLLVQRFTNSGQFLSQYSIYDSRLGTNNAPERLAIDSANNVYITQPKAGLVQQYDANGVRVRDFTLANAAVLATRTVSSKEQILVIARPADQPVQQVNVFFADGKTGTPITLSTPIRNCLDLTTDKNGNLYALADVSQIYKFDPTGKLLTVLGSGLNDPYQTDGSILQQAVGVDSKGSIFSMTPFNPGSLTRFSADLTTITQRAGLFSWCDAWTYYYGRSYTPVAIDRNDRVWLGVNGPRSDNDPQGLHFRPCVLRTAANYLDSAQRGVQQKSAFGLGLQPSLVTQNSSNIFTSLSPQVLTFKIAASMRRINTVTANYAVYDVYKNPIVQGSSTIGLKDGQIATQNFLFTPPKWGWYELEYSFSSGGVTLKNFATHLSFTPASYTLSTTATPDQQGGPVDANRQAYLGLQLIRTSTVYGLDAVDDHLKEAAKFGLTPLVQLTTAADCATDKVQQAVTRFKGRAVYWEIINEPNGSMRVEDYVPLLQRVYAQIKGIDPKAKIVAPACCGIDLNWYNRFYQLGGKAFCDVLSLHDYEGQGAIDPNHWKYKIGQLRAIMANYGDSNKPIWQTERAIFGVRGGTLQAGCQAVRMLLHRDLLESLGIAADTNIHFYVNEHGFSQVPSYIWSGAGAHPAAIALRARSMVLKNHYYRGTLDFGPTGNKMLFGTKYQGANDVIMPIHNLGTNDIPVDFRVTGTTTLFVADAFYNAIKIPVVNGIARVMVPALPVYIVQFAGQTVTPVAMDFGRNFASDAQCTYSEASSGNFGALANGVMESVHDGNPNPNFWTGNMPAAAGTLPVLTLAFPTPRSVSKVVAFSMRADNMFCTLLDYDVQGWNGSQWVTVSQVRTPCPASTLADTPNSTVNSWYLDQNFSCALFTPITTSGIRLVVRRVTNGFLPDDLATAACRSAWGGDFPRKLMLREIEVY